MHRHNLASAHGGPGTLWWILLLLITLTIVGLAVWLYHDAIQRFQQNFIAEHEEAQRQARRPGPLYGSPVMEADPEPFVAPEEIDGEYADVLAQLEQRRKEQRRPKPR